LREIDEQLGSYTALVNEKERLEATLAALEEPAQAAKTGGRGPATKSVRKPNRKGVGEAMVKLISERPGISAAEVGNVLDVKSPHQRLALLAAKGKVEKFDLPAGGKGWRVPNSETTTTQPTPRAARPSARKKPSKAREAAPA
jgi:hypothetical protein